MHFLPHNPIATFALDSHAYQAVVAVTQVMMTFVTVLPDVLAAAVNITSEDMDTMKCVQVGGCNIKKKA